MHSAILTERLYGSPSSCTLLNSKSGTVSAATSQALSYAAADGDVIMSVLFLQFGVGPTLSNSTSKKALLNLSRFEGIRIDEVSGSGVFTASWNITYSCQYNMYVYKIS